MANYNWVYTNSSFWNFLSNLDTRDLKTYLRLILVIFEICQFKNDDSSITFQVVYLNRFIASGVANYDWPFGTLPFGP